MIIKNYTFASILIDSRCLRKGLLLQITNTEGKTVTAEVSPLPGYSHETIGEALEQLHILRRRLLTTWWTPSALSSLDHFSLCPSVRFGIESALHDLLTPHPIDETACKEYALLLGTPQEILQRADEAYEEGYRQAKVKLGHLDLETSHEIIHSVQDKFRLRLDFNRKWNLEKALSFSSSYPEDHFEYIEEPVSNPSDLTHFPYPFALDETLREHRPLEPLLQMPLLKALIVKPTLHYPFTPLLKLGKKIVLSSSFEGPVGIAQIKKLAIRLGLTDTHHGLDTLRYFEKVHDHALSTCALEKAMP